VRGALHEARAKWYDIGVELKLSPGTLASIREDFRGVGDCLREICSEWLKRTNPPPAWEALAEALESSPVGQGLLAQQLRDKYCQGAIFHVYSTSTPSPPGAPPTSQGTSVYSSCGIVVLTDTICG